ncbi:SDR family NAD(P)-dependent oxidoreductase [Kribbella qitaiheensis]|uniref:SDR family NAD(P)-dependent oxidoreductase n=1 Tax=Kribbella qitaiheensis TaxID=1544730 RepID=UPI0019D5B27D|nr:SDR family NAD(P)-dependent oxidoreductase [Kribbella qitaiheensis]
MSSVLIVGGSGGLGREIARYYAERGDSVVVTSRSAERAEQAAAEIGAATSGVRRWTWPNPRGSRRRWPRSARSTIW